jgi:chromosome segregation ATPase
MSPESFDDLIFKLGDIAYERLWNRPNAPRGMERALRAGEVLEQRQLALRDLEDMMDAEEQAYNEFRAACEAESAECEAMIQRFPKQVQLAEGKAKSLDAKVFSKRKDVAASKHALEKYDQQIQSLEELGEAEKAQAARATLKHAKLDLMKRTREVEELQAAYDKIMNPDFGPASEAIRARRRQRDLEAQLEERTEAYNALITELNDQAAVKDGEVKMAREAYEEAVVRVGQEVYKLRIADPALAAFYPKIDKLAR